MMNKDSAEYFEHVLDLFTEILHKLNLEMPLGDKKVTPALAQALQYLRQHDICSVRDVALGLSMTYSAASQLTDRLVRKGWATRCENQRDRRLSEISLTEEGLDLVNEIRRARLQSVSRIMERMNAECRQALATSLDAFITAAIDDERSALATCTHCGKDHLDECVVNEAYLAATGMPIQKT